MSSALALWSSVSIQRGDSASRNVMDRVYENARMICHEEGMDPNKRYIQYPQSFAGLSLEEVIEKAKSA